MLQYIWRRLSTPAHQLNGSELCPVHRAHWSEQTSGTAISGRGVAGLILVKVRDRCPMLRCSRPLSLVSRRQVSAATLDALQCSIMRNVKCHDLCQYCLLPDDPAWLQHPVWPRYSVATMLSLLVWTAGLANSGRHPANLVPADRLPEAQCIHMRSTCESVCVGGVVGCGAAGLNTYSLLDKRHMPPLSDSSSGCLP